jgi:hypothetical protein
MADNFIDPMGQQVPAKYVKPYDRKRDRIARRIVAEWQAEEARLRALKARTIDLVAELQAAAAAAADVPDLGGQEGYIQFRSFDGLLTIRVDNAKRTEFDERLQIAQALIMEAVRELADGEHNADLVEIATRAFQPRKSGNLDMQRIRDLRTYKVTHPKWLKACEIISECERTIGHCQYIRVAERADPNAKPQYITLDIAAL